MITKHYRKWFSSISLSRKNSILKSIIYFFSSYLFFFKSFLHFSNCIIRSKSWKLPWIYKNSFFCVTNFWFCNKLIIRMIFIQRRNTLSYFNIILLCKFKISFIMSRNCHHHSRSIICQNIISNINRDLFSVKWIDSINAIQNNSCFFFL